MQPVEILGRTHFPLIGEMPYFVVLGPHAIYWFTLESPVPVSAAPAAKRALPVLKVDEDWESLVRGEAQAALEEVLPAYLEKARWFAGKARQIMSVKITEAVPLSAPTKAYLVLIQVKYTEGEPETYLLPLTCVSSGPPGEDGEAPQGAVAAVRTWKAGKETHELLFDALTQRDFCVALLEAISRRRHFKGETGEVLAVPTSALRRILNQADKPMEPALLKAEQSNTSVVFGDRLILKLFRHVEEGINPDFEIGRHLTEETAFKHLPAVAGALEYRSGRREPMTLAVLQEFIPNQGDAWSYARDTLTRYCEEVLAASLDGKEPPLPPMPLSELAQQDLPALAQERIGPFLESSRLLGQRTAELHLALAASEDPLFVPEPFTELYQRSIYQSMRSLTALAFQMLRRHLSRLPEDLRPEAAKVLQSEASVHQIFQSLLGRKITAMRIRCHGDFHLGQVLTTGKDFVIIDFEGEPARSLSERRLKRSPLSDVAGMLRSFHYAAYSVLFAREGDTPIRPEDSNRLENWARFWKSWVGATFLKSYLAVASAAGQGFLPKTGEELQALLRAYLLEKAVYELEYELNNRPDWVKIPLRGIHQILENTE